MSDFLEKNGNYSQVNEGMITDIMFRTIIETTPTLMIKDLANFLSSVSDNCTLRVTVEGIDKDNKSTNDDLKEYEKITLMNKGIKTPKDLDIDALANKINL